VIAQHKGSKSAVRSSGAYDVNWLFRYCHFGSSLMGSLYCKTVGHPTFSSALSVLVSRSRDKALGRTGVAWGFWFPCPLIALTAHRSQFIRYRECIMVNQILLSSVRWLRSRLPYLIVIATRLSLL
jgi:hypothetical protein